MFFYTTLGASGMILVTILIGIVALIVRKQRAGKVYRIVMYRPINTEERKNCWNAK